MITDGCQTRGKTFVKTFVETFVMIFYKKIFCLQNFC